LCIRRATALSVESGPLDATTAKYPAGITFDSINQALP
jgi:hypothetical protein